MKEKKRLEGKDLLSVGIFTAVYFVLNLLVAAILGLIPAVNMLVPLVSSFVTGIPMILYFMIFAIIAELILRSGNYQKVSRAIVAFAFTSVGANANVLSMVNTSAEYLKGKAATYGEDYMKLMEQYFEAWWVLPVLIISAFVGGLLGGLLGKKVFKKHFIRSGVI